MKDYAHFQGNSTVAGSRDTTREAFKMGLFDDADTWMEVIKSHNQTSHTYNKSVADEMMNHILTSYHTELVKFSIKMEHLKG